MNSVDSRVHQSDPLTHFVKENAPLFNCRFKNKLHNVLLLKVVGRIDYFKQCRFCALTSSWNDKFDYLFRDVSVA